MSADRIQRLEVFDGWVWDARAATWEDGFAQLTAYVQAEGDARVPRSYWTADGYRLGQWVTVQRTKKDTMSADRRERLEALDGWVWNPLVRGLWRCCSWVRRRRWRVLA